MTWPSIHPRETKDCSARGSRIIDALLQSGVLPNASHRRDGGCFLGSSASSESPTRRHVFEVCCGTTDSFSLTSCWPRTLTLLPYATTTVSSRESGAFSTFSLMDTTDSGSRWDLIGSGFGESRNLQANPSVQLTATSHGLRHMIFGCSITPSRLLLSHQSRRRSALVSVSHFSQVPVADFVR